MKRESQNDEASLPIDYQRGHSLDGLRARAVRRPVLHRNHHGTGRDTGLDTVTLTVRFSMRETDMTPEELRRYGQRATELPGRRVLGAHFLRLHRVQKTPNPDRFGVKPTNNRYETPVNGYAERPPPESRSFSKLGDMVGIVILLPILLIFLAVKH